MTLTRANIVLVSVGLSMLGLVMIYSATYREYDAAYLWIRALHLALGLGTFIVVSRLQYTSWRKAAPALYFLIFVVLVLVLIPGLGKEVGGARRWFDLGPLSVQPAEFAKLVAVLVTACAVSRLPPGSGLPLRSLAAVGALFLLVLLEPDFGTSVVLLAGVAGTLWASELATKPLLVSGAAGFVALVLVMLAEPYRRERFAAFLDPWAQADGDGYQVVQSLVAIKSGGFFGAGAGAGAQGSAVPEIGTDMMFALVAEELGLIGMIGVILAFCYLVLSGFRISLAAPTVLARCMAAGISTMFAFQATFNIGAAMGVLPLAGMTLPFLSYGGSNLIVCFAATGALYRIAKDCERAHGISPSTRRKPTDTNSRRRNGRTRDPRAMRGR